MSQSDVVAEGRALVELAAERGLVLRLLGGVAIRLLTPDLPARSRDDQDVDFASAGSSRPGVSELLVERGYVPDKTFNALYGNKQLYFVHADSGRAVDVIIDKLEMCHTLDLAARLTRMPYTLDPLELLLSKLQIVELNEKDAGDVFRLLATFPLAESDEPGTIDLRVYRELVGDDWGWWRTVTRNLEKLGALLDAAIEPLRGPEDTRQQLDVLARAAEEAPKTRRWKRRARIGERLRWYETPEETRH